MAVSGKSVKGAQVSGSRFAFLSKWSVAAMAAFMMFCLVGAFAFSSSVWESVAFIGMGLFGSAVLFVADWAYSPEA